MRSLTISELKQLKAILNDRFDTQESLDELASEVRGVPLDTLTKRGNTQDIVKNLIFKAQSEKWLIELIDGAITLGADEASLQEFKTNFQYAQTLVAQDPYQVLVLPDGSPFINRNELRKGLRDLEINRNILVVDSDQCVGKTYSLRLIRYIRENTDNVLVRIILQLEL